MLSHRLLLKGCEYAHKPERGSDRIFLREAFSRLTYMCNWARHNQTMPRQDTLVPIRLKDQPPKALYRFLPVHMQFFDCNKVVLII